MNEDVRQYEVNGETVWQGSLYKVNGKRIDSPIHFYIRPLTPENVEAMSELSQNIYSHLKRGEECFIHHHDIDYYDNVFKDKKIHYYGIFVGSHLVGMSYLRECETAQELEEELPNAQYDFFNDTHNDVVKVASFGGDSVLPEYRGNGLNTLMIEYRLKQAQKLGCTDCTSIVDRNNRWNMTPYFACRFNLFETAIDPSDGGKISLLHKAVERSTVLSPKKVRISIPYDRLELIDNLIKRGFIGIDFNKNTAEVVFAHSTYYYPENAHTYTIIPMIKEKKCIGD